MLVTRSRRTWAAVALAAVTTIASAGIAAADNIQDAIEDGGSVSLVAGSSTGASTTIRVIGNNNDGSVTDPGCNWDPGESPLVLDIITPTGVTASPDPLSITECGVDHTVTFTAAANAVSGTASVSIISSPAGGGGYANQVNIPIIVTQPAGDTTAPVISYTLNGAYPGDPDGLNGWWTSDVTLVWTVSEPESEDSLVLTDCDTVTIDEDQAATDYTCSAESDGGEASETVTIKRDATGPMVDLVGGPADGGEYYFGSVPAAPTCTASDSPAGLANSTGGDPTQDCVVAGYGSTVGNHTVQAKAWDRAGNSTTVSHSYKVLAWTATGFYRPVDMDGVVNRVKGGSTVPLKFELFAGDTELTDAPGVKESFTVELWDGCATANVVDNVEMTTTGGTEFRYDTTGGQFVQNWKLPPGKGCYKVTFTAKDQSTGSTLVAFFEATK